MYQIKYENGYELHLKGRSTWGRVANQNSSIVYDGTVEGAEQWLRDRGICRLSAGATHAERQATK